MARSRRVLGGTGYLAQNTIRQETRHNLLQRQSVGYSSEMHYWDKEAVDVKLLHRVWSRRIAYTLALMRETCGSTCRQVCRI